MAEYRPEIIFNGRISELLEVLKHLYEATVGSKKWLWEHTEEWTLKANSEIPLLTISHGSGIYQSLCKLKMPDSTQPEVLFLVEVKDLQDRAKYVAEGNTPAELYDMGLTAPNPHGYVTVYDTTNYLYAWFQPWNLNFTINEKATLKLKNKTGKDITIQKVYAEGYVRPYGRYYPAEEIR